MCDWLFKKLESKKGLLKYRQGKPSDSEVSQYHDHQYGFRFANLAGYRLLKHDNSSDVLVSASNFAAYNIDIFSHYIPVQESNHFKIFNKSTCRLSTLLKDHYVNAIYFVGSLPHGNLVPYGRWYFPHFFLRSQARFCYIWRRSRQSICRYHNGRGRSFDSCLDSLWLYYHFIFKTIVRLLQRRALNS